MNTNQCDCQHTGIPTEVDEKVDGFAKHTSNVPAEQQVIDKQRSSEQAEDVRGCQVEHQMQGEVFSLEVAKKDDHNQYVSRYSKQKAKPQHSTAYMVIQIIFGDVRVVVLHDCKEHLCL